MASDLRFVADTTQRHPDKFPVRRASDRFAQRRFTDTWRSNEAKHGALQFAYALLNRQILENAFLNFLEPKMILVQHRLRALQVVADFTALEPRDTYHPVEIAAHDGRLGRHW